MAKRVLRNLKLSAIAAVDSPAQEGAKMVLLKRGNAIDEDGEPNVIDQNRVGKDEDGEMNEELKKALEPIAKALGVDLASKDLAADIAAALSKQAETNKAQAEEMAALKARAEMSDAERAHLASLEKSDKAAADAFAKMDAAGRAAVVEKAKSSDETFEFNGQTVSKRAVGDAAFAIMKAQSEALKTQAEESKKARDEAQTARLQKRVDSDMTFLAGGDARIDVLKHMENAPEATRKAFDQLITAANKTAQLAFDRAGHRGEKVQKAAEAFEQRVADAMKANPKLKKHEAMSKARREFPDEFAAAYGDGE